MRSHFILYVKNQEASRDFYRSVLELEPALDVPGMTEFPLSETSVLGLMPESGIKRLLGGVITDPETTGGTARAELYLTVDQPQHYLARAIAAGGRELSPFQTRNWGDTAGYVADPDGHVLAFARKTDRSP